MFQRLLLARSGLIILEGKKLFLEKMFTLFTRYFYCLFSLCYMVSAW